MSKRAFGELGSQILFILKSGNRMTVKDVQKLLGGKDNYNTVMTVMSRLVEKKQLARERVGLQYEYWILSHKNSTAFLNLMNQKFSGLTTSLLVNHLVENDHDLSEDDVAVMEKLVQKARKSKK